MSRNDGLSREVDGTMYELYIEHIPGRNRPILEACIGNESGKVYRKLAEVNDEDALRDVMQGLFGGDWK